MNRHSFKLTDAQRGHAAWVEAWALAKALLLSGQQLDVTIRKDTRTLAQNRLMWSCLTDLSNQVKWDGTRRLTPEGWKDYLTAHLNGQDLVPNMDGNGFVAIGRGKSTSEMSIAEMSAVVDLAHMFGDAKGVRWSRTSLGRDAPEEAFA